MNIILKEFKNIGSISIISNAHIINFSSLLWYENELYTFNSKKLFEIYDIFKILNEITFDLDHLTLQVVDVFQIILMLCFLNAFIILAVHIFSVYNFFDKTYIRGVQIFLVRFIRLVMQTLNIVFLILWSNNAVINQVILNFYKVKYV